MIISIVAETAFGKSPIPIHDFEKTIQKTKNRGELDKECPQKTYG
jgi:hypothetical protein